MVIFHTKTPSMGEAVGTEEQSLQDYLLRELDRLPGRLLYLVVQKVGNELTTVVIEINGPRPASSSQRQRLRCTLKTKRA